jgi:hypothetical protein
VNSKLAVHGVDGLMSLLARMRWGCGRISGGVGLGDVFESY